MPELKNKKVNQQFRCFVWKEVSKVSRGKVNGEIVKDENDMVVEWIWRLYCMAFEGSVVSWDWRSIVTVPL